MRLAHPVVTALLIFVGFPVAFLLVVSPFRPEGGNTPTEDWMAGWVVWAVAGYWLFGRGRLRERIEEFRAGE